MLQKVTKRILLAATAATILIAGPAGAGTLITYYGWAGGWQIVGYKLYCDSGALNTYWGGETEYYSESYVPMPDC